MILPAIFFEVCPPFNPSRKLDVSRPFRRGDWLYVTDGRILVRCPIDPACGDDWNAGRTVPEIQGVIDTTAGLPGRTVELPYVVAEDSEIYPLPVDPPVSLAGNYLAMLDRHDVYAVKVYGDEPGSMPVTFEGEGFEGWLMPAGVKATVPADAS